MGEYEKPEDVEYKIQVSVNPNEKTITIRDNGLGMTEEEIDKYINQIAFSGVQDFMEKYKDRQMKTRSSVISVWAFIPHLWWQIRLPLIPYPIRRMQSRCTGSLKAALTMR